MFYKETIPHVLQLAENFVKFIHNNYKLANLFLNNQSIEKLWNI